MSSLKIFPTWGSALVLTETKGKYVSGNSLWSGLLYLSTVDMPVKYLIVFFTDCLPQLGQCILFSVDFTPSPPPATTADFGSYLSLLWTNTASLVRACLIIWWERFRGSQKEDDCGSLSIQSSLACPYTVKKFAIFPSPAGTSLNKLSLAGDKNDYDTRCRLYPPVRDYEFGYRVSTVSDLQDPLRLTM